MTVTALLIDPTINCPEIGDDWISPSKLRPLYHDDPGVVWLELHGAAHGFAPDMSPYAFLDFIAEKGRQFEAAWLRRMAPEAIQVCANPRDVRSAVKVRETLALMAQGVPVIAQAALWWPEQRIYGAADLIARISWLAATFPTLAPLFDVPDLAEDHYVVLDLKFTSGLDENNKKQDAALYAVQVRIYSAMLGHMQGIMPAYAFLVGRDRISDPLPVAVRMALGDSLGAELEAKRAQYLDIKQNGAGYLPWRDTDRVGINYKRHDERWHTAKRIIAHERTPGRAIDIAYYVGANAKRKLAERGYHSLDDLLRHEPAKLNLDKTRVRQPQLRAILQANRSGAPVRPPPHAVPGRKRFEFFVDFEFFSSVNVDFERQWPTLEGCEMIFMIGVGWEGEGAWHEQQFVAPAETHAAERELLEAFANFMSEQTGGALADPESTAIYHWTHAERTQIAGAIRRHDLLAEHVLGQLPWVDLCEVCEGNACAIPGAWDYGLKKFVRALAQLDPALDPQWPNGLGDGLAAQVMGWHAYRDAEPLGTSEMRVLGEYLSADCRALWKVLTWMRI